jgi:hypothetical protein
MAVLEALRFVRTALADTLSPSRVVPLSYSHATEPRFRDAESAAAPAASLLHVTGQARFVSSNADAIEEIETMSKERVASSSGDDDVRVLLPRIIRAAMALLQGHISTGLSSTSASGLAELLMNKVLRQCQRVVQSRTALYHNNAYEPHQQRL